MVEIFCFRTSRIQLFRVISSYSMGSKTRNKLRKSRKSKGFAGVPKWSKSTATDEERESNSQTQSNENNNIDHQPDLDHATSTVSPVSASRRKMETRGYRDENTEISDASESDEEGDSELEGEGYRLINLESLSDSIADLHKCAKGKNKNLLKLLLKD